MATTYTDVIQSSDLPDSLRPIFSQELEFTARPELVTDQPQFVEEWEDFGGKRGTLVTKTVFHQLPKTIGKLSETTDVDTSGVQDHQVSVSVDEYGNAIGTTEKLDLASYLGPVSNIIKTLLGPQMAVTLDTLARNALWYGQAGQLQPQYKVYSGGRADRWHLTTADTLSAATIRQEAYKLGVRRVPVVGSREPSFLCMAHPSAIFDLMGDTLWVDANKYAGATRLFNGEVGMMHGVRFLKSDQHRVANGGALIYQTTLAAGAYPKGTKTLPFTAIGTAAIGDEITLHRTGDAVTAPPAAGGGPVSWTAPNGKDALEETLVIKSINGSNVTFETGTSYDHIGGDFITNAIDVYPLTFLGGVQPLAKGIVLPPEVRLALPTDKLRRMSYVGWYGIVGYGIQRPWSYEVCEVTGTQNIAPVYPN